MTRLHKRILNATRIFGFALLILIVPATRSQAQFYGYSGYGYPGYGYSGFGYPGYGYPGYGNSGFGYPGYGYPGYGSSYAMPGIGYGAPGVGLGYGTGLAPADYYGYGYNSVPPLGLGYSGVSYGYFGNPYIGVGAPLISGVGDTNPLFGLGLTPLGVQSALAEGALINASRTRTYVVPGAPAANPAYGTSPARPR